MFNNTKFYSKDAAYIVWTGDLVPHDIWDTSREENMIIHESLLNLVRHHFPNTPIYPTLGNHEAHPVNTYTLSIPLQHKQLVYFIACKYLLWEKVRSARDFGR